MGVIGITSSAKPLVWSGISTAKSFAQVTTVTLPSSPPSGYVSEGASADMSIGRGRRQQAQSAHSGSPVRFKVLLFLLSFGLLFSVAATAVPSSETQPSIAAVSTTQLAAWLAGGVTSTRLARLVQERGLATLPTHSELRQIEAAGADRGLIHVLSSGNALSARVGDRIPEALLRAAAQTRQLHYHEAELELRGLIA